MVEGDLTRLTLAEASELVRTRAVSSSELLEATLGRLEETEPLVHAYALVLHGEAREAARRADDELRGGRRRGALHGIPLGVKDVCHVAGHPTEVGSRVMAGYRATEDATVVEKLREAGAVLVGKHVTHEWAFGLNTPATRNPWNVAYHPGSSSAGSGASVAAGSAFASIGSDSGGSIRNPASMDGVVGLKPTFGRVSKRGFVPMSPSFDHAGPLARTVRDAALVLEAIAGHDPRDPASIDAPVPRYAESLEEGVDGVRIGVERAHFFSDAVEPDVREAVEGALADLTDAGATVVELSLPELSLMVSVGSSFLVCEMAEYHRALLGPRGDDYDENTRFMLELGQLVPATLYLRAVRGRTAMRCAMRDAFARERLDALVSPTLAGTSFPIEPDHPSYVAGDERERLAGFIRHMIPANVTGQPAMSVPCGFSAEGMPIGLQLIGRPFDEETLFRIARAYERRHDWCARRPL